MKFVLFLIIALLSGVAQAQEAAVPTLIPRFTERWTFDRGDSFSVPGQYADRFAFSPDGLSLAAGTTGGVHLWDLNTGAVIRTIERESSAVSWSPDGRWLTTGDGAVVSLWDAATGELRGEFDQRDSDAGRYVSWAPDSSRFAVDSRDVINPETGERVLELEEAWAIPYGVLWSPDGERIAITTSWTGSYLHLYSAHDGRMLDTYGSEAGMSWSPHGTHIAAKGQIRDVSTGLPSVILPALSGDIAWSPDGRWVASTRLADELESGLVFVWDAASGHFLTTLEVSGCNFRGITWSADSTRFAAGCFFYDDPNAYRSEIRVWAVKPVEGEAQAIEIAMPPPLETEPSSVSPNGLHAALDTGEAVEIYSHESGELIDTLDGYSLEPMTSNPWSSDGLHLLLRQRSVNDRLAPKQIWTRGNGLSAPIYNAEGAVWWSPDSARMATVSDVWNLRFYEPISGDLLHTVRGYPKGQVTLHDGVSNPRYIVTLNGIYPLNHFAITDTDSYRIIVAAPVGIAEFSLEGDTFYVTEWGGPSTAYDLTGQREPVVTYPQ